MQDFPGSCSDIVFLSELSSQLLSEGGRELIHFHNENEEANVVVLKSIVLTLRFVRFVAIFQNIIPLEYV